MTHLQQSLAAWQTPRFNDVLKKEIEALKNHELPLQQALSQSSQVAESSFTAMIIKVTDMPAVIWIKTGIQYSGIIAGCNCADDPAPIDEQAEYCELQFDIDKETATTEILLLPD